MATEQNELGVKISTNVDEANKKLDKLLGLLDKGANKTDKFSKSADNIKRAFNFGTIYSSARKFFELFNKGIDNINKYSETLNMFHLVMGDLTTQADKFQNTMAEAFGNNTADQLEFQSYFQSLTESMGLQEKYAYIISENMSKLTYDLSSLFDKEQKDVATALRAGLVGQTKPVRNFGMDITENSLQPILDSLGIDRTVRQLSQVEKEIVRYIALLRQSSIAHGDMANTIESPANQLRIFKNQLAECSRWFGALFINLFAKAIPYINAFLMVLKEIMRALATMFGIKIQDYNSGIATFNDYFDDTADSVAETTKNVKELRRQTLKFDEINNINENNSNSGSGGAGGVAGGIDQRLLDAITGYDNGMEKVRMKATEIRDKIMNWLGFLKKINPLTGEISWEYEGIKKTLSNMWKSFLKLNTQGKIFVALGLATVIGKIATSIIKTAKAFGSSTLASGLGKALTPIGSLINYVSDYSKLTKSVGYKGLERVNATLKDGINAWSKTLTFSQKLTTSLVGAGGLAIAFSLATDSARDFNKEGEYTAGVIGKLVSSEALGVLSGALIGASWGGALGAVAGGLTGLVAVFGNFVSKLQTDVGKSSSLIKEECDEINSYVKEVQTGREAIEEALVGGLAEQGYYQSLVDELEKYVEANGKVKLGYEDRVNFILTTLKDAYGVEYELVNGQIKNYDSYIGKIKEVIEKKKAEIMLEANQQAYADAIKNRSKNYAEYTKAVKKHEEAENNLTEAQKNYNEAYEKFNKMGGYTNPVAIGYLDGAKKDLKEAQETLKTTEDTMNGAEATWKQGVEDITKFEQLQTAIIKGDSEEISKAIEKYSNTYTEKNKVVSESLADTVSRLYDEGTSAKEFLKENGVEISDELERQCYSNLDTVIENLKSQTTTVEDMTPEIVDAWGSLAKKDHDKFVENIEDLPEDVKTELLGKMEDAGYDIGVDMQTGIDKSKTEIDKTTEKIGNDIPEKTKGKAKEKSGKKSFWSDFWNTLMSGLTAQQKLMDFTTLGSSIFAGILRGLNNSNKNKSFFTNFANGFMTQLKSALGIHSPSKLAKPIGMYTFMGIEKGMEEEIPNVEKTAYKLLNTLETTFDDGMYDLSLKSAITPNLTQDISNVSTYSAKTNIDYNVLEQASYNGFSRAIKQYGLVNINVKQDKGSIVETAIEGINDITRQTGENPIDLW